MSVYTAREKQKDTPLSQLLKEPGPDAVTILDNRPKTAYQRQLQQTMDAHASTKAIPLQRKMPQGSARFQQIAMNMGAQYGVDTSGLKATRHSAFPSKLNAEATIQRSNIHFALGKDTDDNIRHEVAHAIDNTMNGTPKGDQVVNGQRVDTTREQVVDRMIKEPLPFDQASTNNRLKVNASGAHVLQRKLKIEGRDLDRQQAWRLLAARVGRKYEKPFKEGIYPVYDAKKMTFGCGRKFSRDLSNILPHYSDLWNTDVELSEYIRHQLEIQQAMRDDITPYEGLFTTVGFEHEFADMIDSPISGVSHLELARSILHMPMTRLPFVVETDANNSLELVSPPFLMPTVHDRPLPDSKKVGQLDRKMQKSLQTIASKEQSFEDLMRQLVYVLNVPFKVRSGRKILPENLSHKAKIDRLRGFVKKGRLLMGSSDVLKLRTGKSEKVQVYRQDLENRGLDASHADRDVFSQINFAADLSTINLFEETENDADDIAIVKGLMEWESWLSNRIKQPVDGSKKLDDFYIHMIRKLSSTLVVPYQKGLSKYQYDLHSYIINRNGNRKELKKIQDNIKSNAKYISRVKDTRLVWVKDHVTSMAKDLSLMDLTQVRKELVNFHKKNALSKDRGVQLIAFGVKKLVRDISRLINLKMSDLKSDYGDDKPKVNGLYDHDSSKVGARQNTYINPKSVQRPGLWPEKRLHVAEMRRGNIEKQLEEAFLKSFF